MTARSGRKDWENLFAEFEQFDPDHPAAADPIFVISVAAELADMHPQTLRQYDRLGLVVPHRQGGGQRRYSVSDVHRLRRIQQLSRDGISLEGIRHVVELEREVHSLRQTISHLVDQVNLLHAYGRVPRTFTAAAGGDVVTDFRSANMDVEPEQTQSPPAHRQSPQRRGDHDQRREVTTVQRARVLRALDSRLSSSKALPWRPVDYVD
ncbi:MULTISPECIES: heat shock protein transcriptional repressor HspR [unclassified Auritidibacter]|uniref:heat shock protein transcriptional repressor HspR n=1 Tax=Auritidibacter TaxID=1160973 RepID=UPI000D73759B|nr:MerR family transcriptional regulator [Auritidibacter sp. NML130574]PXA78293.1 hypothetical protein DCC24_01000 [Auritidibacter sp. NML100628]PXA79637.1 hypothetical protein DCC26_05200 [Auritidibacter sp. NML120779]PXA81058.1 hypothetical protein DCC25_04250 [Auritidibacter sp. NML120636]